MALQFGYVAVVASLLSALVALGANRRHALLNLLAFPLLALSGVAAVIGGTEALLQGNTLHTTLPLGLPWLHWQLRLDPLSGFFLIIIGLVLIAVALYGPGYCREFRRSKSTTLAPLGFFTGLFVTGMLLVLLADDAFSFMIAWELMSLSSYFLVAYQHEQAANRRAAFLYLLMAHIGGLAILLGYGVLAAFAGGFGFEAMRAASVPPLWAGVAFALAFVGFGMKAGLVPLHAWLPEAHPVAPSHVSALMSGVMLKVAVYGFIRVVFDLIGNIQWQWGVAVLIVGAASALLGVLYTLVQNDLKRLLAYSSIENIGIIFTALGLAMIFIGTGHPVLGRLGLMAALLHALNHALFKSLLFLGAGAVLQQSHERDLEKMGGLLRRMPWTGLFFLIGTLSISALPPFNGFASEWLTFQTALQAAVLQSGVLRIAVPVSAAVLALTGALGAAAFVKVYGVAFLGQPRSRHARHPRKTEPGMRLAQGWLALLCLAAGILPAWLLQSMDTIPRMLLGGGLPSATSRGWLWLTPVSPQVASYSAPLVLVAVALTWLLAWLLLRPRRLRALRTDTPWDCGFGPPDARMQYTATAFAMPIRRIFRPLWQLEEQSERTTAADGVRVESLRYRLAIGDRAWSWLYAPLGHGVIGAARRITRLQSGNIRTYLAWSFITLLVLLWLIS